MKLQGRNLEPNLSGDDVKLLQSELRRLKLKTQIVDQEGLFGSTTFLAVQEFQRLHGLKPTGIVDAQIAQTINREVDEIGAERFVVRGEVREADGDPLRGLIVRVFRKGLRADDLLGQATTAPNGGYSIEYQPPEKPISLVVQASDTAGKVLATSPVICKAHQLEIVNLSPADVFLGPSEFKQLQERLAPILRREQIRIEALEADDVGLLACAHDLNPEHIAYLVASSRIARETGLEAEAIYALVRQELPPTLIGLVAQQPETLQRALETSVSENIVSAQIGDQIPRILRELQGQIVRLALAESTPDRPTFRTLLDIAGLPQQRQQTIVAAYVERKGSVTEFWQGLREQKQVGDEEIETLQYTIATSAIALNHQPLIRELTRMRRQGQVRNLRDLARFDRDDWEKLIKTKAGTGRIGAPELLGEKEDEREKLYADFLPRLVESVFPTAVLTNRLERLDRETFAPTLEFLRKNADFEFRATPVNEFLRSHPNALDGVTNREASVNQLHAVQRMMNIAPQFNKATTITLIAKGIDSAFKIRRMGATQFVRTQAKALGSVAAAEQVYTNAARQSDTALLLLSQSKFFNPTSPGVLPPHLFGKGLPDLEDLFGSLDLCQCDHCASVYSPAAYLVDLLHFLMNRPSKTPGRTALDVLFGDPEGASRRRWDIGEIELTCHNTNTALPHVDLVNEILENAIVPAGGFPFQTEGEASSLGANPEHINEQAYNVLASAVYPWSLPFDLWAAESRRYLVQLGVRRADLMEHFRREGAAPLPIDVAAEHLGLTRLEKNIINGSAAEPTRQMWGMSLAEFNELLTQRSAAVLLDRSGLSYEQLVELLDVQLVNPGGGMRIDFAGADCNIETATITGLTDPSLARMHRFVRLQRKLGWPISELGDILASLGMTSLNDDALTRLAQVKRLREPLEMPLETMLAWWPALLSTQTGDRQPSLYDRVFNEPTVNPPVVDIFRLNNARTQLANPNLSIFEHVAEVSVALGVGADDLALLFAEELPDDRLNLANLTRVYKASTLAKALKITLRDYCVLRALTGLNPFENPGVTERFVERARLVRESGFDLATLDYLLRHRITAPAAMTDAQVSEFLTKLRAGLEQIAADHKFVSDPSGARTADSLALILPADVVNRAIALLNNTSAEDEANRIALVNEHFAQFLDETEAVQQLVNPGTLKTPEERFNYVLERLLSHLSRVAGEALVAEALGTVLGLSAGIAEQLLRELVPAPNDANQSILSVFMATLESPEQSAAFHRLAKIAVVINALKVPPERVAFTINRGAALGWLDLNALLLATQDSGAAIFERWLSMVTLFRAAASFPDGIAALFAMFDDLDNQQLTRNQFLNALAERTGWSREDLGFLSGANGLNLQFRADFVDGRFLVRLKHCLELLAPLSVSAQEAWRWAAPAPNATIARAIKQVVRAKFDDRLLWFSAAKPIRDDIREQQRAALVAFLVDSLSLPGPNDLFAHFLVDVEMAPCMLTSRIVLATNSVQLFVQRCLLNLEPQVEFSSEDAKEWAWMKNYRVWEANRKVFLYPENWIEPELRDDKTPFFVNLESGLLQDEIHDSTVEREYLKYLQELDRVARLEISGVYREWEVHRDVLHVIGRTRNAPNLYYHRKWIDQRYWTPWERIEADIEGDHLVPVVWNRRLYLFWPIFLEKALEELIVDQEAPRRQYEIRLAWSEYRDGKWSPKRVTNDFFVTNATTKLEAREQFSFWAQFDDEKRLYILCDVRQHRIDATNNLIPQQFRFAEGNGSLEVTTHKVTGIGSGKWDPFEAVPYKMLTRFLSTYRHFNGLREFGGTHKLTVFTEGEVSSANFAGVGIENLTQPSIKLANVLLKTPGRFSLMLPNTDRLFISRSPFFFQDDSRTFLIVPRGKYVGGGGGPIDELTVAFNNAPLELPDIISSEANNALTSNKRTRSNPEPGLATRSSATGSQLAARRATAILAPQMNTRQFTPLHWEARSFRFENFYHPYVGLLIEQLNRHGLKGILKPDPKTEPQRPDLLRTLHRQLLAKFFWAEYQPNQEIVENVMGIDNILEALTIRPIEEFDFAYGGAYAVYNWELFFHAPFLIAKRLGQNQRFEAAQQWYHHIFDPTYAPQGSVSEKWPQRVWQIKPFFEHGVGKSIQRAMLLLKSSGLTDAEREERKSLQDQIEAWRKTPFSPHLIARMRHEAYMKAVVMAYLDNLIAWADHLFRQDSRESINEATQLYILAAEILGERPREIPAHEGTRKTINGKEVNTFNQLKGRLDDFSNALITLETIVYPSNNGSGGGGIKDFLGPTDLKLNTGDDNGPAPDLPLAAPGIEPPDNGFVVDLPLATPIPAVLGPTLFFCIPKNDKLLGYWDTVADRLFKIRHCLNIEGVARQLALFSPPIDPGLLVKAAAAGLDIGAVLGDLNTPLPHYRFQVLTQKANEMLNDVKGLGGALLAALEKKDAEELSLLRSTHEIQVLESIREVKRIQIEEAKSSREALEASKLVLEEKQAFYDSRELKSKKEQQHLDKLEEAQKHQARSNSIEMARAAFGFLPDFDIGIEGFGSSPTIKGRWGGSNILSYMSAMSQSFAMDAHRATHESSKALTEAGYERRQEEWSFQADQAAAEIRQIKKQITAAEIRVTIAEQDLKNHELQVDNAKNVDEFMRSRYTNQELFGWMISQVAAVYFQSYQVAADIAKRAERTFRHELGIADSNFIEPGYWDSLKKGLMAGDRLQLALRRMEVAYLDQNRREYEITKHISLAMLDPVALITLRSTGECFVDLPETLFDMDYPGHYMRRIKTVGLTIPCVVGPYTSINCTLTLLANSVRRAASPSSPYARSTEGDDPRFADNLGAIQSIATSGGQNDSGLFELNFRDERYLPFEGAGAISRWRIALPIETNRFDRNTISDVIIHMRYTAREGGEALRAAALPSQFGWARLFSLRHEFPTEWHRFLNSEPDTEQVLVLRGMDERFPFRRPGATININRVILVGRFVSAQAYTANLAPLANADLLLNPSLAFGGMHTAASDIQNVNVNDAAEWTLHVRRANDPDANLEPNEVENLFIICLYSVSA